MLTHTPGVASTSSSYEMNNTSVWSTVQPTCCAADTDQRRSTVLPPICSVAMDDDAPADAVAGQPACDDFKDDSAPPLVRFKNRYRRAQLHQQQQQHLCDWNHNDTTKLYHVKTDDYSPTHDDIYYDCSSSEIGDPRAAVRSSNVEEKNAVAEKTRFCEKRLWSRVTPAVDEMDEWVTSSKMSCHGAAVHSTRIDVGAQSQRGHGENLPAQCLEQQYRPIQHRSSQYQNYSVSWPEPEPKCEPALMCHSIFVHYSAAASFTVNTLYSATTDSVFAQINDNNNNNNNMFQRISVTVQRFDAVLLHGGFLSSDHPD